MSVPSIGRIVHYRLNEQDAEQINRRRDHARAHMQEHQAASNGAQVHVGNSVRAGDVYPLIITKVWSETPTAETSVNGQLMLDGNDIFWVTSTQRGDGLRQFFWPPRV